MAKRGAKAPVSEQRTHEIVLERYMDFKATSQHNIDAALNRIILEIIEDPNLTTERQIASAAIEKFHEEERKLEGPERKFTIDFPGSGPIDITMRLNDKEWKIVHDAIADPTKLDQAIDVLSNALGQGRLVRLNEMEGETADQFLGDMIISEMGIVGIQMPASGIIEGEERKVSATEIAKSGTTIAVALRLNQPIAGEHPEAEKKPKVAGGTFTYQNVVFAFTPTEEELADYNRNPQTFRRKLEAILEYKPAREAFLRDHRDDEGFSIYIPPVGIETENEKLWNLLSDGVTYNDPALVRYLIGDYYNTHGETFANGFKVEGIAQAPTKKKGREISLSEKGKRMEESFAFRAQGSEYYSVEVQTSRGVRKLYVLLTEEEAEQFKKQPRQVLFKKTGQGRTGIYSEEGTLSRDDMNTLTRAMESPTTRFKIHKTEKDDDVTKVALFETEERMMPGITSGGERKIAASEKEAKRTNIAIALKARNFIESNVIRGPNQREWIRFDHFVFSFQPTAKELAAYNENPTKFRIYVDYVLSDPKLRQAFLERHAGMLSIYIPKEGYVQASAEFKKRYPNGVLISGNTHSKDSRIRDGILGYTLDAAGHNYPSGIIVRGVATFSTTGGIGERVARIRSKLPIASITRPEETKPGKRVTVARRKGSKSS